MFVVDTSNNIGRRCDISGGGPGQHWVVKRAMRISGADLCYLVRHDETGEWRVAAGWHIKDRQLPQMTNLR